VLAASIVLVVVASRRAEALANLQMDFVTSISHELRTPLAAILSAGQNITDGFAADLKLYGWLITTQARQQIDLVDQILLFASSRNGAKNYVLVPLQVGDVFDQVRRDTATLFERSGFTVEFHIAPSLPPIMGDLRSLSRCLQNLIGNAAKYSGQSRWIGVSAELEEPENPSKGVWISVADRGIGICSSDLPQIFEPFYRSSRVVATQIHGTGLGLSVTKHLVEAIGGSVSVRSEPGVGSVFTLHFRVATVVDSEMVA
jgi:two-component system phosphate regulon sensor histidine kinase PhoR